MYICYYTSLLFLGESGIIGQHTNPPPAWPLTQSVTFNSPFEQTPTVTYGLYLLDAGVKKNNGESFLYVEKWPPVIVLRGSLFFFTGAVTRTSALLQRYPALPQRDFKLRWINGRILFYMVEKSAGWRVENKVSALMLA